jgi:hypothetical protein
MHYGANNIATIAIKGEVLITISLMLGIFYI